VSCGCRANTFPALRPVDTNVCVALSKRRSFGEGLAAVLAGASDERAERLTARARASGPWPIIAISFLVATEMFGCSTQRAPENQYTSPAPTQSYPPVPRRGKLEVASWYGPGFVGHVTSDGEAYNPNELTAASKTLPMGSRVRVTNPDNGRSVVVRINDRGPFVRGRSLDLSRDAAQQIGLTAVGVGRVRVRVLRVTSHDHRTYGRRTRGPTSPAGSASKAGSLPYIRRTTYH
jgi:rare lipoprotein A